MKFPRIRWGLGADVVFNLGVTFLAATSLLVLVLTRVSQQVAIEREAGRIGGLAGLFQRSPVLGRESVLPETVARQGEAFFLGREVEGFALVDSEDRLLASGGHLGGRPQELWLREIRAAVQSGEATRTVEWRGLFPFSRPTSVRLAMPLFVAGASWGLGIASRVSSPTLGLIPTPLLLFYLLAYSAVPVAFSFFLLSRSVIGPVRRMARVTGRIAEGDLTARAPSEESAAVEIGQLAESLNAMVQRIETDQEKLAENVRTLRRMNEELKRAQTDMIRAEKLASVGRLSSGIAHEIGNPLGAILGYLEILLAGTVEGAEARDCLVRVEKETRRIKGIVEGLLRFARPGREGWEVVDVNPIIAETVALLREQKVLRSVDVEEHLAAGLPLVRCEPHLLEQVIVNLILNAVDAMPEGGTISFMTEPVSGSAGGAGGAIGEAEGSGIPWKGVRIEVSDTGIGIDPESLPKIFEPFYTTKDVGKGTGLGLAIVFWTVESFGGRIRVRTGRDQGTTFSIELPAVSEEPLAEA